MLRYVEGLRHEFDENRRRPPLRPNEPPFAGSAVWAHSLARGVEEAWLHLKNLRHMAKASSTSWTRDNLYSAHRISMQRLLNQFGGHPPVDSGKLFYACTAVCLIEAVTRKAAVHVPRFFLLFRWTWCVS